MQFMEVHDATHLLKMEYAEMPDLKLTPWQAQRLFNLSSELCDRALSALTASGFLCRTGDGSYVRVQDNLIADSPNYLTRFTALP